MTQDPSNAPSSSSSPSSAASSAELPPVDQVIHDIRESSGTLRTPEGPDPLTTTAPSGTPDLSSAHTPAAPAMATAAHARAPRPRTTPARARAHDAHDAHADAHAHGEELGPIDWMNWAAGALGVAVALAITVCFVFATQGLGAY